MIFGFSARLLPGRILSWQDRRKTAYLFEGGDVPPLLGWLQQELDVWPRGEWHVSL